MGGMGNDNRSFYVDVWRDGKLESIPRSEFEQREREREAADRAKVARDHCDRELLRKIRGNPEAASLVGRLRQDAVSWHDNAAMFATIGSRDEFMAASLRRELLDDLVKLLSPPAEKAGDQ